MNSIIIDTREKLPLKFKKINIINQKLDFGDYGIFIKGKLLYTFERKAPEDLLRTLIDKTRHKNLKKEMQRAVDANIFCPIVVECSYTDFINKKFE